MKDIKIRKEEFDTSFDEIKKAEKIWGFKFPKEYSEFLLKNNGGVSDLSHPTIGAKNNAELWEIDRFMSVGDIILQKKYLMEYTWNHEHNEYDLAKHNLKKENLLTFAIAAEGGCYYINLDSLGQIYFCNYAGGDGIVQVNTNSFKEFINSLEIPDWIEIIEDDNSNTIIKEFNPLWKIKRSRLFDTPDNPQLGFIRFKEVFEVLGDIQVLNDVYSQIANFYVYDRLKIEYLIDRGCSTDGLLYNATNIETIKYLVEEKGLDINKRYNGKYPLQNYLIPNLSGVKGAYLFISDILEYGIELDWFVTVKNYDGTPDMPLLERLKLLNEKYWQNEISDKKFWVENGSPKDHIPFKRCELIEEKIRNFKKKKTRGNKV